MSSRKRGDKRPSWRRYNNRGIISGWWNEMMNRILGFCCIFLWNVLFYSAQYRAITVWKAECDLAFRIGIIALLFVEVSVLMDIAGLFSWCCCSRKKALWRNLVYEKFAFGSIAYVRMCSGLICLCVAAIFYYNGLSRTLVLMELLLGGFAWLRFRFRANPRDLFVVRFSTGRIDGCRCFDKVSIFCALCLLLSILFVTVK